MSRGESRERRWSRSRAEAQMVMKAISTQGPTSREYISVSEVFITCNISHMGVKGNNNNVKEKAAVFAKMNP